MLLVADHDLCDRNLAGLPEHGEKQPVGLLSALVRLEVVGLAKVDWIDLVHVDEVADVDRMRQLDVETIDVLVRQLDVAALLDFEAAHDLVRIDVLARVLADLVVPDRLQVALRQEVETQLLRLGRRVHAHRHRHEAEGDRAAPDCTRHRAVDTRVSIRPNTATTRVTRGVDIPQKASPPSGGVDSWGRLRRPQVVPRPGKRLWILWRGRLHEGREPTCSCENLCCLWMTCS